MIASIISMKPEHLRSMSRGMKDRSVLANNMVFDLKHLKDLKVTDYRNRSELLHQLK
jgi:hypothetical protein